MPKSTYTNSVQDHHWPLLGTAGQDFFGELASYQQELLFMDLQFCHVLTPAEESKSQQQTPSRPAISTTSRKSALS